MNFDWILAILPWLALLACPAVMFWMMRGMGSRSGQGCGGVAPPEDNKDQEIRALRARVEELEARARDEAPWR